LDEHSVLVFGVLNVTPDSFSDGGRYLRPEAAVEHGQRLAREGADVIDVGGESTRPRGVTYGDGFADVSVDEERRRVVPVVRALADAGLRVSIDTTKPEVAESALEAGACIVNDTSCGASARLIDAVAANDAELVLMHNRGRGEVHGDNIVYDDIVRDVSAALEAAFERATAAGIRGDRVWIDPGLGFAKSPAQSIALHASLAALVALGHPVLLGASRKGFLGALGTLPGRETPDATARLGASIASALFGARVGVRGVRVHDVQEVAQALRVASLLSQAVPHGSAPCS
jgi:dihydropteroate synthase